jgi:hypothetical protein
MWLLQHGAGGARLDSHQRLLAQDHLTFLEVAARGRGAPQRRSRAAPHAPWRLQPPHRVAKSPLPRSPQRRTTSPGAAPAACRLSK